MHFKTAGMLLSSLLAGIALFACGSADRESAPAATDYSQASHWLALPVAPVPALPVDLFYLYPTAWTSTSAAPQVCAINEPTMLAQAPGAFARQATAFETVANIYAPYYRQNNSSPTDRWNIIAGIPTLDATAAFDYYIKHYNNGRPFILVGHSQGATVLTNLLSGYLKDHPEVLKNMVAAYVVGSPISQAYLDSNRHLKFAAGADDTGVIISYNTEGPVVSGGPNPVLYGQVGRVINPISWTTDESVATTADGLGSFMPHELLPATKPPVIQFTKSPQYADARIDKQKGVLICTTADKAVMGLIDTGEKFPDGVYHTFDIPFYYYNLRANAQNRVNRFLGK